MPCAARARRRCPMSARSDNERLTKENDKLRAELAEAAANMANLKRFTEKAERTDDAERALKRAHEARDDAWKQVVARDAENTKLAKELEAAIAAQGSMPADLIALKRIVTDHIVESMTGPTYGIVLARRLRTEM